MYEGHVCDYKKYSFLSSYHVKFQILDSLSILMHIILSVKSYVEVQFYSHIVYIYYKYMYALLSFIVYACKLIYTYMYVDLYGKG